MISVAATNETPEKAPSAPVAPKQFDTPEKAAGPRRMAQKAESLPAPPPNGAPSPMRSAELLAGEINGLGAAPRALMMRSFQRSTGNTRLNSLTSSGSTLQPRTNGQVQRQQKTKTITIIVKKKQNLYRIALEYGTTVAELQRLNNLETENIQTGQALKVPAKSSSTQQDEKEADDIYGNMPRPRYGDYTLTKADLEKTIPYTDPVSGTSYECPVKETFYGIWASYQIDYAQKGAHLKGKDPYGQPKAFAAVIVIPLKIHLFFSIEKWNEMAIQEKVRAYDSHPSWGLADDLRYQTYPKLNAELERRIRKFKLDNTTTSESLATTTVFETSGPVLAQNTKFGKWFESHRSWSELYNAPIPPGPLKHLGDNSEAVITWNKSSLQQKVDYFNQHPE